MATIINNPSNESSNTGLSFLVVILFLAIIGGGAYYLLKEKNTTPDTANITVSIPNPVNSSPAAQ